MGKIDTDMVKFFNDGTSSDEQKEKKKAAKRLKKANKMTDEYMADVTDFLKEKAGGEIPKEWKLPLSLLKQYYKQWLLVSLELEELDSYIIGNYGGVTEHPLINIQTKMSTRLEKQIAELGLSLKSGKKLDIVDPKKSESALDAFLKGQTNKEIERR